MEINSYSPFLLESFILLAIFIARNIYSFVIFISFANEAYFQVNYKIKLFQNKVVWGRNITITFMNAKTWK